MGKGVGAVKSYISNIKKGRILLELQALISKELFYMLKKLTSKLSENTSILVRSHY